MQRHPLRRILSTTGTALKGEPARRAVTEFRKDKRGWLRHGIAALAISGLGLGVAGAVAVTGTAQEAASDPGVSVATGAPNVPAAGVAPEGSDGTSTAGTSRNAGRSPLADPSAAQAMNKAEQKARQQAQQEVGHTDTAAQDQQLTDAAEQRAEALKSTAADTEKLSEKLSKEEREQRLERIRERIQARYAAEREAAAAEAEADQQQPATSTEDTESDDTADSASEAAAPAASGGSGGGASLPIAEGSYSIAAGFGEVGSWSRYHTGVDFSAAMGTPILAAGQGVVTNAGVGSASGWAGNYVTIEFADGQQMLYAHMSSVSVSVGQTVSGGQVIGHVGMTGRSFGPHVHTELYPAGVTPGDVYSAVDPMSWFRANGVG